MQYAAGLQYAIDDKQREIDREDPQYPLQVKVLQRYQSGARLFLQEEAGDQKTGNDKKYGDAELAIKKAGILR